MIRGRLIILRVILVFLLASHQLVCIEGKHLVADVGGILLSHMNTALVILKLLLSFKSLLAPRHFALKFILVLHSDIVLMGLHGIFKGRIAYLRCLDHAKDSTLVAEVRAPQLLLARPLLGTRLIVRLRTVPYRIHEANKEFSLAEEKVSVRYFRLHCQLICQLITLLRLASADLNGGPFCFNVADSLSEIISASSLAFISIQCFGIALLSYRN